MSTPNQSIPLNQISGQVGAMLADDIRANIVRLRETRGWSRPCLGKRLMPPTSGQQIERLEKGQRNLDPDWIERIAKALSVEPVALVAGEQNFDLTPQVADGIAVHLARFVLRGDEPDQAIVQGLSILLQEMSATFSRNPQARRDPLAARTAVDILARQLSPRS